MLPLTVKDPPRRPTVLVVDDDGGVRVFLLTFLTQLGFEVLLAPSGEAALEVCRAQTEPIRLALIDVEMPGLDGPATASVLREVVPGLPSFLMSGGSRRFSASELLALGALGFIEKPFRDLSVLEKLLVGALK